MLITRSKLVRFQCNIIIVFYGRFADAMLIANEKQLSNYNYQRK